MENPNELPLVKDIKAIAIWWAAWIVRGVVFFTGLGITALISMVVFLIGRWFLQAFYEILRGGNPFM